MTTTKSSAGRLLLLPAAVAAVAALGACGAVAGPTGPTVTEDVDVAGASAVVVEGTGDLTLTTGETPSLRIRARESTMDRLTSEVRDGVLVLGVESSFLWAGDLGPIEYELVLPELDGVTVRGTGDVTASAPQAESLTVRVEGTGNVSASDLDVAELVVRIEGTGGVDVTGRADHQDVRVDGTGSYSASDLDSRTAVVDVNGTGGADVTVRDTLDAHVRGTGSVTHAGGADVRPVVDGIGSVRAR